MVEQTIITIVSTYLNKLREQGIPVQFGVIYGSQATGHAHQWSDIDLLVISPHFDKQYPREDVNLLWRTAGRIDSRIEPIPVGLHRFETDGGSPLLTIARREGQIIRPEK